jgi:hypothetical protein
MNFIINNKENFQTNSSIPNINTRNTHHLQTPNANLPCFPNSTFYAGIKIFNSLPRHVTILMTDKYLNSYTFYSADEFFICKEDH